MGTYSLEQVISMYASGQMDVEMTTGHILQHLKMLKDRQVEQVKQAKRVEREIASWRGTLDQVQGLIERQRELVKQGNRLEKNIASWREELKRVHQRLEAVDRLARSLGIVETVVTDLTKKVYELKADYESISASLVERNADD